MEEIEINIYWNDLSDEGKDSLIGAGFTPNDAQEKEIAAIGTLKTR